MHFVLQYYFGIPHIFFVIMIPHSSHPVLQQWVSGKVFSIKKYFVSFLQHIVSSMEYLSVLFSWVMLVQGWWKNTSISKDLNTITAKGHTWLTWQVIENITVIGCFTCFFTNHILQTFNGKLLLKALCWETVTVSFSLSVSLIELSDG